MPAFAGKKRKSAGGGESSSSRYEDDKGSDGPVEKGSSKRGKGSGGTAFQPSRQPQTDADGNQYWEISKSRRVTVSDFKGKQLVNVREYYLKDDEWLPGKKVCISAFVRHSSLFPPFSFFFSIESKRGKRQRGTIADQNTIFFSPHRAFQ